MPQSSTNSGVTQIRQITDSNFLRFDGTYKWTRRENKKARPHQHAPWRARRTSRAADKWSVLFRQVKIVSIHKRNFRPLDSPDSCASVARISEHQAAPILIHTAASPSPCFLNYCLCLRCIQLFWASVVVLPSFICHLTSALRHWRSRHVFSYAGCNITQT